MIQKSRPSVEKGGISLAEDAGVLTFFLFLFGFLTLFHFLFVAAAIAQASKSDDRYATGQHEGDNRFFHSQCFWYRKITANFYPVSGF